MTRAQWVEALLSAALAVAGVYLIVATQSVAETQSYSQVGPRVFPRLVGGGFVIVGALLLRQAIFGGFKPEPEAPPDRFDAKTFAIIAIALLAHMALIGKLGFVLAGALLFYAIAFALGARKPLRDVACAIGLALAVYLVFTRLLNVTLPAGVLRF